MAAPKAPVSLLLVNADQTPLDILVLLIASYVGVGLRDNRK
jgi:hypothetical protein